MNRVTKPLRSRFLLGFEMLSPVYDEGDLFVLDMDSVNIIEWHAPVEWLEDDPPPGGTPITRSPDGALWAIVRQPDLPWVQVLEPIAIVLPLELFQP